MLPSYTIHNYGDHVTVEFPLNCCSIQGSYDNRLAKHIIHDNLLLPLNQGESFKYDDASGRASYSKNCPLDIPDPDIEELHCDAQCRLSSVITELYLLERQLRVLKFADYLDRVLALEVKR